MASDLPQPKRVRLHAKRFCDNCNCFVSKSTWYNHRDVSNHTDAGACSHSLEVFISALRRTCRRCMVQLKYASVVLYT